MKHTIIRACAATGAGLRHAAVPLALAVLSIGAGIPSAAMAQRGEAYPTKPIRLVVPFAADGGTDMVGRVMAPRLAERLGRPVLVEKPGLQGIHLDLDIGRHRRPREGRLGQQASLSVTQLDRRQGRNRRVRSRDGCRTNRKLVRGIKHIVGTPDLVIRRHLEVQNAIQNAG